LGTLKIRVHVEVIRMRAKLLRYPPTAFMFLLSLTVAAPAAAATVKLPVPSLTGRSSVEADKNVGSPRGLAF
jgi:hypothetical protein